MLGVYSMEFKKLPYVRAQIDAVSNIRNFNSELKMSRYLQSKLSQFRAWYYDAESKSFGPSKYIGYLNMNEHLYREYKEKHNDLAGFSGTNTEPLLRQWYTEISRLGAPGLYNDLEEFLMQYDKKLHSLGRIYKSIL